MDILQTERGRKWLSQFDKADLDCAERLATGTKLVSQQEIDRFFAKEILLEAQKCDFGSVALFCARELEADLPEAIDSKYLNKKILRELPRKSYFPEKRCEKPDAVGKGGGVGSEGHIANLIRDLSKEKGRLLDHPCLDEMAATKTRKIIIVDDIIGSGNRIRQFLDGFCKHKTYKSWRSGGYVELVVLSYAAMEDTKISLLKDNRIDRISNALPVFPGSATWTSEQKDEAVCLCKKYAVKTSRPSWALGYKSVFSCICFEHKCPNTAPAILWANSASWIALFESRPVLGEFVKEVETGVRVKSVLKAVRYYRLARELCEYGKDENERIMLTMLALIGRGIRTVSRLAFSLSITNDAAGELLSRCIVLKLITPNKTLSPWGRKALKRARKKKFQTTRDKSFEFGYYFPQSLR